MAQREKDVHVPLSDAEMARLDELRGGTSRPAYLRSFLQEAPRGEDVASHEESLAMLTMQARDGKVSATIALEKALREQFRLQKTPEDELDAIAVAD